MKTEKEVDKDILFITMKIQKEYPELSKYLIEIPVKFSRSTSNGVNTNNLEEYYNSLVELLRNYSNQHLSIDSIKSINMNEKAKTTTKPDLSGYPENPPSEDVYNHWKEETDLNPEDLTKRKTPNEIPGTMNEKDFIDVLTGSDLDIPGSELDDKQEKMGNEDEENNYYSLGGDAHNNLEEDKG